MKELLPVSLNGKWHKYAFNSNFRASSNEIMRQKMRHPLQNKTVAIKKKKKKSIFNVLVLNEYVPMN